MSGEKEGSVEDIINNFFKSEACVGEAVVKTGNQNTNHIDNLLMNLHLVKPRLHKNTPTGGKVEVAPLQCSVCWTNDHGCEGMTEKIKKYRDFCEGFGKLSLIKLN